MRFIKKGGDGGFHLNHAHLTPPSTNTDATNRWQSFRHKSDVNEVLALEQYGLCAYSEIRPDLAELGTHIEHIRPKSNYPSQTFDYHNLVLSALSSDDLRNRSNESVFGGHAKLNDFDPDRFISCLQSDCASYFVYLSDGRVEPNFNMTEEDQSKSEYTINLLNLNSPYLVNQRKRWLDELSGYLDEHINHGNSIYHLACLDLIPSAGKLSRFFTATRQLYQNIAEQVLADAAPELIA